MIHRIDHIAVAVRDHDGALHFFRDVLGAVPGERSETTNRKFFWQTLSLGDLTRLELLSPAGEGSFLEGFLRNRVGGFHHITLHTSDLEAMIRRLEEHGVPYFGKNEYPGGVWKEVFIHPRDAFGVLIQIAEFCPDDWIVPETKMPTGQRWEITREERAFSLTVAHPGGGKVTLALTAEEIRALAADLSAAIACSESGA